MLSHLSDKDLHKLRFQYAPAQRRCWSSGLIYHSLKGKDQLRVTQVRLEQLRRKL